MGSADDRLHGVYGLNRKPIKSDHGTLVHLGAHVVAGNPEHVHSVVEREACRGKPRVLGRAGMEVERQPPSGPERHWGHDPAGAVTDEVIPRPWDPASLSTGCTPLTTPMHATAKEIGERVPPIPRLHLYPLMPEPPERRQSLNSRITRRSEEQEAHRSSRPVT